MGPLLSLLPVLASVAWQPAPVLPRGLTSAPGTDTDAVSKLPKRVTHDASGMTLVLIPAGSFEMGKDRIPRTIKHPYYLGTTEVTTGQYARFVESTGFLSDAERGTPDQGHTKGSFAAELRGDRQWRDDANWKNPWPNLVGTVPGFKPGNDFPSVHLSWNDASAFCKHYGFTLPSETQWEYACRAGSVTLYPWGDDPAGGVSFANVSDESQKRQFPNVNVPFPFDDGYPVLAPAGAKKPNSWGLHDMIGNLEEWCADDWCSDPFTPHADESPRKAAEGAGHVLRGGSWIGNPGNSDAVTRPSFAAHSRRDFIGFRVAVTLRPVVEPVAP